MVFLANPNNPTGSYLDADELVRLHAGLPEDVLLVIDAAYAEYVRRNDYTAGIDLVDRADNVVMTRTFSKLFGLAALRVGWLYAQPHVVDVLHRIRGPFNVSTPAQVAGIAALEDLEHQERARAHNERWLPWLGRGAEQRSGLEVHPSVANFVLVAFETAARARRGGERLARAARRHRPRRWRPTGCPVVCACRSVSRTRTGRPSRRCRSSWRERDAGAAAFSPGGVDRHRSDQRLLALVHAPRGPRRRDRRLRPHRGDARQGQSLGLADRTTTVPREAVAGADLVVIGTPVGACGAVAEAMAPGLEPRTPSSPTSARSRPR